MECDFCKKTFSTKYLLSQHQKKTKYCLDIQGEQSIFECNFCHKHLSTKDRLIVHANSCKEKTRHEYNEKELVIKKEFDERLKLAENIIQEKNDYISKLEAKLEKLESTVTTIALEAKTVFAKPVTASTTNNTTNHITVTTNTNNFLNLSKEHVNKVLTENIDYNVVYAGQSGLATLVVEKMLTDQDGNLMYHCVDPSRQMFEFTGENGEKVRDLKAEKLIQSLLKGDVIRTGLEAAAKGWNTEDQQLNIERTTVFGPKVSEYADLNRNNTVFRSKVSSLTT